jgi:hypothetical protein
MGILYENTLRTLKIISSPYFLTILSRAKSKSHSLNLLKVNSFQAISVIGGARIYFPLTKQCVNFLQNELGSRNIYTNFGAPKRDIQRAKITHI